MPVARAFAVAATLLAISIPAAGAAVTTQLVSTGPADSGPAFDAYFNASAENGALVFFTTPTSLVASDQDLCPSYYPADPPEPCPDLYVRDLRSGATQLVSTGPTGGSSGFTVFHAASEDGRWAIFSTTERLVAADTNGAAIDLYARDLRAGTTHIVSTGASGAADVRFGGASRDRSRVAFVTPSQLTPDDTDSGTDTYVRDLGSGALELASVDQGGPSSDFEAMSSDGYRVFFITLDRLVPEDTDGRLDLYARDLRNDVTQLVAPGANTQGSDADEVLRVSDDGARVLIMTEAALVPQDDDVCRTLPQVAGCHDIYERNLATGTSTLVSVGTQSPAGPYRAYFEGASEDFTYVAWRTQEAMVPADINGDFSLYLRDGPAQTTRLVSKGPNASGGTDGELGVITREGIVFFDTTTSLGPQDTDSFADVYRYDPVLDQAALVSTGSGAPAGEGFSSILSVEAISENAVDKRLLRHGDVSPDGRRLFFESQETLVPSDANGFRGLDLYMRDLLTNTTTLLSTGPTGLNGSESFGFGGIADGGGRGFYESRVQLVASDADSRSDVYATILNQPPQCATATAHPRVLLPGNRNFRRVSVEGIGDPDGDPVTVQVDHVTQDEPVRASSDRTSPDAIVPPGDSGDVRVRAERNPHGDGRVYRIEFTAADGNGSSCSGTVEVTVPRKKKQAAIDSSPPAYDSLAG